MSDLLHFLQDHPKTHLIFDVDETLFRLLLPWDACFLYAEEALRRLDNELYESYQREWFHWGELQNKYIAQYGKKAKDIIYHNNSMFETKHLRGVEVNHTLVDFVKTNRTYTYHIWTSNTRQAIVPILRTHGIHDAFSAIVTRTDVAYLKPHHEGFTLLYDPQISKTQYLMIGDSVVDKQAAEASGIDFFLITDF